MGRSQETFNKKEVKNKKDKKRKEKEKKRLIRKETGKKSSFDDMIAYVDENGMISSTPPDPSKKIIIDPSSIELGNTKSDPSDKPDYIRKGVVNRNRVYLFMQITSRKKSKKTMWLLSKSEKGQRELPL